MILTDYDVQFWVGVTEIQENGKTESLPQGFYLMFGKLAAKLLAGHHILKISKEIKII